MKLRLGALVWLFLSLSFLQLTAQTSSADLELARKIIKSEEIRAHIRFLSDSLLTGRAPGTPGYDIAARYVASELEAMGLHPGVNNGWYQQVPLAKAVTDVSASSLVLSLNGQEQKLVDAKDCILNAWFATPAVKGGTAESDVSAPLVFVGFGVTAPDQKYDDFAGIDVHGKILVRIAGAPSSFPSTERAYYSDNTVKARNAMAHGAVA